MSNQIKLTFLGDADSLAKASKKSDDALGKLNKSADASGKALNKSAKESADFGTKMGHLGSAVSGANDAIGAITGGVQALISVQSAGAERASRLAHAEDDVKQAMLDSEQAARDLRQAQLDLSQSQLDGRQAALDQSQSVIDSEQASIDATTAQNDYNAAVKEHGKNSVEARQAALDLKQAQQDLNQAMLDGSQAQQDASQYQEDGNQALLDGKQAAQDAASAQHDLIDALREAKPTDAEKLGENLQTYSSVISAIIGILGLATAAQWLFNAALWASPITWIVLTIAAFVAIMIYLATQTTVFQDTWKVVWDFLKGVGAWFAGPFSDFFVHGFRLVMAVVDWFWAGIKSIPTNIKNTFATIEGYVTAPFRAAFNFVAAAWNATIGRLSWTVPSWVPGIGGNSISAPKLSKYHQGGIVSGAMGAETLAVLQAGERVTPAGGGHAEESVVLSAGGEFDEMVLSSIRRAVGIRGGDPVRVLRSSNG
ncbi:MAG: hypothetical protein ACJ72N_27445 [Labedaea sp.]